MSLFTEMRKRLVPEDLVQRAEQIITQTRKITKESMDRAEESGAMMIEFSHKNLVLHQQLNNTLDVLEQVHKGNYRKNQIENLLKVHGRIE